MAVSAFPGRYLLAVAASLLALAGAAASAPSVVISIKPLHGLAAGVMQGVGTRPLLLLSGASSPHSQALKPSQAAALEHADLVIWIGESLEIFLRKPLTAITNPERLLTLESLPGIRTLAAREAGVWAQHTDAGETHAGIKHSGHGTDPHLWLAPDNAVTIVNEIARRLSRMDPGNGARYHANAARLVARIHATDAAIAAELAPVRNVPYVVFHDAYQYFEHHYGTNAAGAISVSPDRAPGARRLKALRTQVAALGVRCIFAEPQFEPRLAATLVTGTPLRSALLDPLGASVEAGPQAWFSIMTAMAASLRGCLSG